MHPYRRTQGSDAALQLAQLLDRFAVATPELLDRRGLLKRVDAKYLAPIELLPEIVAPLVGAYAALRVASGAIATYRSLYLDSADFRCFHDHRRGRRLRHKIRLREYPDREVSFLEIKSKFNKELTVKRRLSVPYGQTELTGRELAFLREHTGELADSLAPRLWVNYRRVSLIALEADERMTIDLDLEVSAIGGASQSFGDLAIIETKRAPNSGRSVGSAALAAAGLRDQSFSKYIVAIALVRPEERRNRLLPALRSVERILR